MRDLAGRRGRPQQIGTRRYAPSSRLPVAGIYVLMAAVCARTRVPIAILSGVVHIIPAKVLLSFSRVCSRSSRREGEYWSYSRRQAWRATISCMNSAAPRSTLDLGSGLGRWRRGPGRSTELFMRFCAGSSRLGIETPEARIEAYSFGQGVLDWG